MVFAGVRNMSSQDPIRFRVACVGGCAERNANYTGFL